MLSQLLAVPVGYNLAGTGHPLWAAGVLVPAVAVLALVLLPAASRAPYDFRAPQ